MTKADLVGKIAEKTGLTKANAEPKAQSVVKAKATPKSEPLARTKVAPQTKPAAKAQAAHQPVTSARPTGRELADLVAAAAAEHKPTNPVLLDLSGLSSVADWFFIASADNPRQMDAIAEKIVRRARERGVRPLGREGLNKGQGHWVLVDLGDVVVHIFNLEARELYDLEGLWTEAPRRTVKA